jgi:glutamate synthase (NADPH/NADH) large chain
MFGGMAFVYDVDGTFATRANPDTVVWQRVETLHWEGVLKALVEEHARLTQSKFAEKLLVDWNLEVAKFWQVVPKEMLARLPMPLSDVAAEAVAGED